MCVSIFLTNLLSIISHSKKNFPGQHGHSAQTAEETPFEIV